MTSVRIARQYSFLAPEIYCRIKLADTMCTPKSKRMWSQEDTFNLIQKYKELPELWSACKSFKDRAKRSNAIEILANEFNTNDAEIVRKLHNLRTQFNNEIRKIKSEGADEVRVSKWEYFEALKFINNQTEKKYVIDDSPCNYLVAMVKNRNTLHGTSSSMPVNSLTIGIAEPQISTEYIIKDDFIEEPNFSTNTSASNSQFPTTKKRKKIERRKDDDFSQAPKILRQSYDDDKIFGDFVASSLRNLCTEKYKKKLKRLIQRNILEISEQEDAEEEISSTSSTP